MAGTYHGVEMDLSLRSDGSALTAEIAGASHRLQRCGDDRLLIDAPVLGIYALSQIRDAEGTIIGISHGPAWFTRAVTEEPPFPDYLFDWDFIIGHYRCHNPWLPHVRVVLRRGSLLLNFAGSHEEPLIPLGDGLFRVGEHPSPERARFDAVLDGKAQRLDLSGQ